MSENGNSSVRGKLESREQAFASLNMEIFGYMIHFCSITPCPRYLHHAQSDCKPYTIPNFRLHPTASGAFHTVLSIHGLLWPVS